MTNPPITLPQITSLIQNQAAVAVYFSAPNCGICHVLKPKIEAMLHEEFPLIQFVEINIPDHPEIAGQHRVFTAPTLLVFFDGKEYIRHVRNMGVAQVADQLRKPYLLLTS